MTTEATPKKRRPLLKIIGFGILGLLLLCIVIAIAIPKSPSSTSATPTAEKVAAALATAAPAQAQPTAEPKPSATTKPTNTPAPSATPKPTNTPAPTPKPVDLKGTGQTATDKITLPAAISVARFTHAGSRNFAVKVFQGSQQDLLINTIGAYDGTRPLISKEPIVLDITADGAWTVHIEALGTGDAAAFQGKGDAVSPLFTSGKTGAWEITHDGKRNFAVFLHCAGGSDLVQNEIGAVNGSKVITFSKSPCFWEVVADGAWSLKPRP